MKKAVKRILKDTSDRFYCYQWQVLDFKDTEDVHQMRVAGRTLLSYFYVLAADGEASRPAFLKIRKPLKDMMSILGEIRDKDVLIEEMEKRSVSFSPEEKALIEGWLNQERVQRTRLRELLAAELPGNLSKKWKDRMRLWIKNRAPELADKASIEAKVARLRKKKDRALKAIKKYPAPDMTDEEFLNFVHVGRISVKRLRYALNILKKLGSVDKSEINALKALQDKLGHVQDMRVWSGLLYDHYGDNDIVNGITSRWRGEMLDTLMETGLLVAQ